MPAIHFHMTLSFETKEEFISYAFTSIIDGKAVAMIWLMQLKATKK